MLWPINVISKGGNTSQTWRLASQIKRKNNLPRMTHLTDDSVLPLQEVMVRGTYHLDSRGAEHRWLPPTLQNCENLPPQHQYLSSIQQYLFYVTLVSALSCPGFHLCPLLQPRASSIRFLSSFSLDLQCRSPPPPLLLLLASLLRKSSGNQLFVDAKSDPLGSGVNHEELKMSVI